MPRKQTDYIIIHCAATRPSMDIDAKEIDRWHRERGFLRIGYHYVIKRDGTIEDGRMLNEPGAHARKYNWCSVGICMVGGVKEDDINAAEDNFTDEQWVALYTLVQDMLGEYPLAKVIGHNEISNKFCPSFDVQNWLRNNGLPYQEKEDDDSKPTNE